MSETAETIQKQIQLSSIGIEVDENKERVHFNYNAADPKEVYDLDLRKLAGYFYNIKNPRKLTDYDIALCIHAYMDAGLEEKGGGPWAEMYSPTWQIQNPGQVKRLVQLEKYISSFIFRAEQETRKKSPENQVRIPAMVEEVVGPHPFDAEFDKVRTWKSSAGGELALYRSRDDRRLEYIVAFAPDGDEILRFRMTNWSLRVSNPQLS